MGGDNFKKLDDNSNYEIDINAIIKKSKEEHDKRVDEQKARNINWRDSFIEAIWRKMKNKVNNEITEAIRKEIGGKGYTIDRETKRSIDIQLINYIQHSHPPGRNKYTRKNYYIEKNNLLFMSVQYFFENGLSASRVRGRNLVDPISGLEIQNAFCSHIQQKIAGCKSVKLMEKTLKRRVSGRFFDYEEYTQYIMEIVW